MASNEIKLPVWLTVGVGLAAGYFFNDFMKDRDAVKKELARREIEREMGIIRDVKPPLPNNPAMEGMDI